MHVKKKVGRVEKVRVLEEGARARGGRALRGGLMRRCKQAKVHLELKQKARAEGRLLEEERARA